MTTNASYKLPDLLSLCDPFELRTNRACRAVTAASESWLVDLPDALTERERDDLRHMKMGLLAALCFPTCDQPQLRLVTDFWTLLVVANRRAKPGQDPSSDNLLTHLAVRLQRLEDAAPADCKARFRAHMAAHQAAEQQLVSGEAPTRDIDMYMPFSDAVEALDLPQEGEERTLLDALTAHALDLIAWSWDIVAYNVDQSVGRRNNAVQVILDARGFSIQGAVTVAFSHAQQAQHDFLECERSLRERLEPPSPPSPVEPSWAATLSSYIGLVGGAPPPPDTPRSELPSQQCADALRYVQGLRDCIAGVLHWAYETEMFFGRKQEVRSYIRTFGWVFLLEKSTEREEEANGTV
ncbi:hypothetical protein BD626DRAFT_487926 [Schizophyllum amplum]|uniref:Terpenoid synthase n=1 Tax=Schizophyllum amplum TaxID=97359 RepID=A0A550CK64_9AGAR|nr:hypothetical protein BD626DRAFT_487926 [Auriculariopsis ampla]